MFNSIQFNSARREREFNKYGTEPYGLFGCSQLNTLLKLDCVIGKVSTSFAAVSRFGWWAEITGINLSHCYQILEQSQGLREFWKQVIRRI